MGTHQITAVVQQCSERHGSCAPRQVRSTGANSGEGALNHEAELFQFPAHRHSASKVTLTATVTPTLRHTGTVTFSGISVPSAALNASGVAAQQVSLPAGKYSTITASYGGDSQTGGSTSPPITLTVNKANPTVSLTSPATAVNVGQSVTFNASVTPVTASGSVQFLNGAQVLTTGPLKRRRGLSQSGFR